MAGFCLWAATGMTWAGPLEEYLAHPRPVDNAPWRFGEEPWNAIPKWSKQFNEGKTDRDKAIAIGNLVMTAERMATFPKAREASIQLMDQMVMPNIEVTKRVDIALFCAWWGIMLHCASVYKAPSKFLASFYSPSRTGLHTFIEQ